MVAMFTSSKLEAPEHRFQDSANREGETPIWQTSKEDNTVIENEGVWLRLGRGSDGSEWGIVMSVWKRNDLRRHL
jgi:hypothetical protein